MKTLLKLAMGVAIASALVKLLGKRAPAPSNDGPVPSIPVETLDDSSGTPLSAAAVVERHH